VLPCRRAWRLAHGWASNRSAPWLLCSSLALEQRCGPGSSGRAPGWLPPGFGSRARPGPAPSRSARLGPAGCGPWRLKVAAWDGSLADLAAARPARPTQVKGPSTGSRLGRPPLAAAARVGGSVAAAALAGGLATERIEPIGGGGARNRRSSDPRSLGFAVLAQVRRPERRV